jgi:hypothetical protein
MKFINSVAIVTALSASLVAAQTPAPTSAIEKAANEATNSWQIGIEAGSVSVGFNDASSAGELGFNLNITQGQTGELQPLKVYDYDTCATTLYTDEIIGLSYDTASATTSGSFELVPALVDIKTAKLNDAPYFGAIYVPDAVNTEQANIKFCVLAELGSIGVIGATSTSVSYVKLQFDLTITLSQGFTSASVDVTETTPDTEAAAATVAYTVDACECDAGTRVCDATPTAKTQNSPVNVCITTTSTDVVIDSVKSLSLNQATSGITLNAITDGTANSITSTSAMGTKSEVVSTRLVSAFFSDPTTVTVSGVAVMKFANVGRKLVSLRGGKRSLQEEGGESSFNVDVVLSAGQNDESASAASMYFMSSVLSMALAMGVVGL